MAGNRRLARRRAPGAAAGADEAQGLDPHKQAGPKTEVLEVRKDQHRRWLGFAGRDRTLTTTAQVGRAGGSTVVAHLSRPLPNKGSFAKLRMGRVRDEPRAVLEYWGEGAQKNRSSRRHPVDEAHVRRHAQMLLRMGRPAEIFHDQRGRWYIATQPAVADMTEARERLLFAAAPTVARSALIEEALGTGASLRTATCPALEQRLSVLARQTLRDVARDLETAEAAGIIHYDVKANNLLVVSAPGGGFRLMLGDFGHALDAGVPIRPGRGTPGHMAPEIEAPPDSALLTRNGRPAASDDDDAYIQATPAADVYGLALAVGRMAIDGPSARAGKILTKLEDKDPELFAVLRPMLHSDPSQRPSASEVARLGATLVSEETFSELWKDVEFPALAAEIPAAEGLEP